MPPNNQRNSSTSPAHKGNNNNSSSSSGRPKSPALKSPNSRASTNHNHKNGYNSPTGRNTTFGSPRMNGGFSSGNGHRSPRPPKLSNFEPIELYLNQKEDIKFSGNGLISYGFWAAEFQMAARADGIWDMIAPPDGAMTTIRDAMNAGDQAPIAALIAGLIEDMFISIRPGPSHETIAQTIIDNRIHKLTRFYTDRIRGYDYEALTAARREELVRADRREYTEKKLTIELSEDTVLNNAIKSLDAWDEAKKRHGDRSAKCFRLFNSRLKDGPKAYVRPELTQGHFRHAWLKLYMHYNKVPMTPRPLRTCSRSC